MPPWIAGCSVFTRPSRISGKPVTSDTGTPGMPLIAQMRGRPASGNDLDAQKLKLLRELSQLRFIGNRNERPANREILMCGHAAVKCSKCASRSRCAPRIGVQKHGLLLRYLLEFPVHRRGLGALALEHDLQRAPEADRIGEENALLDVDFGAIGEKAPSLAAGRGQRDGVGVARKICRHARMQMKADGEAAEGLKIAAVAGGLKVVVALQGQARTSSSVSRRRWM